MSDRPEAENPEESPDRAVTGTFEEAIDPHGSNPPIPPKRKGGRKPIYSTSEERKQRNRQAQAAFRERRTEYIKQLEASAKDNEETIENLETSQRDIVDECHRLRDRTLLLETLLDEHDIEFRPQLHARSSRPLVGRPDRSDPHRTGMQYNEAARNPRSDTGRGLSTLAQKPIQGLTTSGLPNAPRSSMASPQTSVPSPSSFLFLSLSPSAHHLHHHPRPNGRSRPPPQGHGGLASHGVQPSSGEISVSQHLLASRNNRYNRADETRMLGHRHASSYDLAHDQIYSSASRRESSYLVHARTPKSNPLYDQTTNQYTYAGDLIGRQAPLRMQAYNGAESYAFDDDDRRKRSAHLRSLSESEQSIYVGDEPRFGAFHSDQGEIGDCYAEDGLQYGYGLDQWKVASRVQ